MTRPLCILLGVAALLSGLWVLGSKPASAYLLGHLDDEDLRGERWGA